MHNVTPHILIVDDDASLIESLSAALCPLYGIGTASNGQSALSFLKTHRTDLIILDLVLGDEDGLDLLPHLRERTAAPILMLSAHGNRENLLRAIRVKPDEFLDKPIDLHTLRSRVRARLQGDAAGPDRLESVRGWIARELNRPLTTEDLARSAGMSRIHLRRAFTERFGMTPRAYLEECRMTRAATLLRETDKAIKVVAPEVGFKHPDNFSTAFKRFHGLSPEAFRARHRPSPPQMTPELPI